MKQIAEKKVNEGWRDPLFLWDFPFENFSDSDCFPRPNKPRF